MYNEMTKQMLGKQMTAESFRDDETQYSLISRSYWVSPTIHRPYSLQIYQVLALFQEQVLYLNSLRRLRRRWNETC